MFTTFWSIGCIAFGAAFSPHLNSIYVKIKRGFKTAFDDSDG